MSPLKLYSYYRSSCSYRVRIVLNLKDLKYEYLPVHLLNGGGEQHLPAYRTLNPKREVPTLVHDSYVLPQSMAIIDYLDQLKPSPRMFPADAQARGKVMQFCEIINSGIQPLQNLSLLQELKSRFEASESDIQSWCRDWITRGFESLEILLKDSAGSHCFGGSLTAADAFLVPQVYNAHRFGVEMARFPIIDRLYQTASQIEAFQRAAPERQVDAPPASPKS
ncbi:MAG: maleylacetoacetate isomerase [Bdellovibrionales bacterium]|nr:maleylacetoacetate isomerase [Bdellovibrionales bacterium]